MTTLENTQYGWGDGSSDPEAPFWVKFSRCASQPVEWDKEIRAAAVSLANSTSKPIWICLSGGIDSEVVCEIFQELDIPFRVLTVAFRDGVNAHDIKYAHDWCAERKIEQRIVDFDLERFAELIPKLLDQGHIADHFFRYFQVHLVQLVEEMGGFAILGGGEQLYELNGLAPRPENVALNFDVGFSASLSWCKKNRTVHEPFFYFSRPEIIHSWMKIPLVEFCLQHPEVFVHPQNKYVLKVMAMRIFFPRQKWRPKYNGFEKVEAIRHRVRRELRKVLGTRNQNYRLAIGDLSRQIEPLAEAGHA